MKRSKANRVLSRQHTGHSKYPLQTTLEMTLHMDITRWSIPKSDCFAAKVGKAVYSQQKQDLKLNMAQIMRSLLQKLKRVEKITRPFRCDWNQIPYACTVEVTNRFKELVVIDRDPEELWKEVCNIVQEEVIKTIPKKKKCKKVVRAGFTNSWVKKRSKRKRRKGKLHSAECRVSKNSKERDEMLPKWTVRRNRGKQ